MTDTAQNTKEEVLHFSLGEKSSTVILNGTQVDVNDFGDATIHTNASLRTEAVANEEGPAASSETSQISFSDDFNSISLNGTKVTQLENGSFLVSAKDSRRARIKPLIVEEPKPKIGDKAEDGWIYSGVSKETGREIYVAPQEAGVKNARQARKQIETLKAQGIRRASLRKKNRGCFPIQPMKKNPSGLSAMAMPLQLNLKQKRKRAFRSMRSRTLQKFA